jgi:hypothetical protein
VLLAYAIGFSYALIVGSIVIKAVMDRMEEITDKVFDPATLTRLRHTNKEAWRLDYQPILMGLIERTLYMSALLFGHGEFIAVWLGLKVAGGWKRWQNEKIGRYLYSRSLFGSGLSLLYALMGFLLIEGISSGKGDYAGLVSYTLAAATWALWIWLKRYTRRK